MAAAKTRTNIAVIETVDGTPHCRVVFYPTLGHEIAVERAVAKADAIRTATGNVVEVRAIDNQPVK